jgi:hypothetical protein
MNRYRSTRRRSSSLRPLVAFLIVASFGILFAGCAGSKTDPTLRDEFSFTEKDVERLSQLESEMNDTKDVSDVYLEFSDEETSQDDILPNSDIEIDLSLKGTYESIRSLVGDVGDDIYQVINPFLNVRKEPKITSDSLDRLERGDRVHVLEFIDATWARIKTMSDDKEGYVAHRYLGKIVSESGLADEKKKFDGMYFVDFSFLNVRRDPDAQSPKIGELPSQAFVTSISQDETWVRIQFEGKEAYVAREYLSSFSPNFLVRQDEYNLAILIYDFSKKEIASQFLRDTALLNQEGFRLMTVRDLSGLLVEQEVRDARLQPKSIIIGVTGVTVDNIQSISETINESKVPVTVFLQTRHIGLSGITEKNILTILANNDDIQSGGYTGDDLRALTNAQVTLELTQSRQMLESIMNRPVTAILYPRGGVNYRVMEKTVDAGYLLGIGTASDRKFTRDQLLRLPSIEIPEGMSSEEFILLVNGKGEEDL